MERVSESGEMFSGKHKTTPFLTNKQNSSDFFSCLPILEYFSYLLWILGYLANVHITNWESEIKSREKNKIFKRTCRGYWLVDQHAHQTHNLPQFVCQSVRNNSIFRKGILSPLGLSNEITKKRYTISVLILKNSSDTVQEPISGSCNI